MIKFLQKIKFKKIIYPGISLILAVLIVISFVSMAKFLSKNVNKVFLDESEMGTEIVRVNLESLRFVEKKLGL